MAGDPRQLPPTVKSQRALDTGLDCTLFARLAELGEVLVLSNHCHSLCPDSETAKI